MRGNRQNRESAMDDTTGDESEDIPAPKEGDGLDRYEPEFEEAPEGFEETADDEFFDGAGRE